LPPAERQRFTEALIRRRGYARVITREPNGALTDLDPTFTGSLSTAAVGQL